MNPYHEKLAKVLVNYSADVQPGMSVGIMGITECEPVMIEVYKEVLRVGAHPMMMPTYAHENEIFYTLAKDEQIEEPLFIYKALASSIDRMINIWADVNTKALSNIPPEKLAKRQLAHKELSDLLLDREARGEYKWSLTGFPTDARAQDAGMSLYEYENFVYKAALLDKKDPLAEWKRISAEQDKICQWLNNKNEIRYVGMDTDITFSVKGRDYVNCDGKRNFPDGEVYTCPVEDSAEGKIRFTYPLIYMGNEIEDVTLEFKEGVVTNFSANKGENLLREILKIDEGSNKVGELAIGTNYGIDRFTKNMLYDEKIGGTVHLALGLSPEPTVGKNRSSIHLDILKDMRDGGRIFADDELFYENGKFTMEF